MALQSKLEIYIGETAITCFKKFTLNQKIDDHHHFELICRVDTIENPRSEIAIESKSFLNEIFIIQVSSVDFTEEYKELEFKGVVTSVNIAKGFHQSQGDIITISGEGACIITDDGSHYASYTDSSLSDILQDVFMGYDRSKLAMDITPRNNSPLHYCVQHNESAFAYASRLAAQYNEWFYYDGKKLVFGNPDQKKIKLRYRFDLHEFSLNLAPKPNTYIYCTTDYLLDEKHEKHSADIHTGLNGLNHFTTQKSESLFAKKTRVYVSSYDDPQLKQRFDQLIEQQKKATELNQVIIKGKSDNPGVKLGSVISIEDDEIGYGSFRITKVSHIVNENGKYRNEFEGVVSDSDIYPNTDLTAFPKSETQVAKVVENADPKGLSRIKVQFFWQEPLGERTPWLRIVSPHAGTEKGFHFIPEIGEEVLIGFEGGNAEKPYVLGSLYNGVANPSGWKTNKNDIKAIRTRSGHTIELNDAKGSEFITITDKNANIITIDTANNNITITALENMTLNAKNFKMNVKEDAVFNIGRNTTIYTENNFDTSSQNHTNTVENKMNTSVGRELIQNSGNAEIQSKQNIKIACGATASFQGGGNVKISKG
ncbi:type VI secretion system Vgr family protein [Aquimarina aquimarini]|uniref:type VI secretion system Vgr family protein n=1 Tax=Aquimarina aquimarini TaxID=1191734 RepID=UPI000D5626EA|nr:phage baseplate assembly protein V [Aquimarina aquimarini]